VFTFTLVIYFRFESHDAFYRFLANQHNIQILDVENGFRGELCQALFLNTEGLILRLLLLYRKSYTLKKLFLVSFVRWPRRAMTVNTRRFFTITLVVFFFRITRDVFFRDDAIITRDVFSMQYYTRRFFNTIITHDVFSMQ
jgi:hypothetical protein